MHKIIRERLELILQHALVVEERIKDIADADEFKKTKEGEILFDSLITRLQALSENIKDIQKIDAAFFQTSLPLDVKPIIRFRDLASHHDELLNPQIIFNICKAEVPVLKNAVQNFLRNETNGADGVS